MVEQTATYILCPGCECAVRLLNNTPCPKCNRCIFCNRKLKAEESHCDCTFAKDFQSVENSLLKDFVIPQEQVARETRRMEIRKQLEMKKTIAAVIPCGMLAVAVEIRRNIFGDDTWTTLIFSAVVRVGWVQRSETQQIPDDNSHDVGLRKSFVR